MVLIPTLTVTSASDGTVTDLSTLFMSSHSEQTTSDKKDENKYDVTIANAAGQLFSKFAPKDKIALSVVNDRKTCIGSNPSPINIFIGEIQKISADEEECKIEGSCDQGGMVSNLRRTKIMDAGATIADMVAVLLIDFGYLDDSKWHIHPYNNVPPQYNPEMRQGNDFATEMQVLADEANVNWYFDDNNEFWFVPPNVYLDAKDVDGHVLKGQTASNMIGRSTVVNVIGTSMFTPNEVGSRNPTHKRVVAQAKADSETETKLGKVVAPPLEFPNCDQETCQKIADNALLWFEQFEDVCTVVVEGIAPKVYSKVSYHPFNGSQPPLTCSGVKENAMAWPIVGLVTKRTIDISPDIGLECTLEVTTKFNNMTDDGNVYEDPTVAELHPEMDVTLIPGAAILDIDKYQEAFATAMIRNDALSSMFTYNDIINGIAILAYNPSTSDAYLTARINGVNLPSGYIESYPSVGTTTPATKAALINSLLTNGWPSILGA